MSMIEASHVERDAPVADALLENRFRDEPDWIALIKELRQTYGLSLYEAETLALTHRGWRRWCNGRIDADPECRKLALGHLRRHGSASLIVADGDRLRVRRRPAARSMLQLR